jgi:multidrug efflux pump subunit AcrB
MNIPAAFIRRPVATALLMVAIVLLGATAYERLPVAALPNVAFPTISVTAQLPGADPQTMASSVATPLEKQFGQIPYLTQMTSTSSLGYTQIVLQFALNDDINAAAQLVQTAINAAAGQLPKNLPSPPTYHETNPSDAPILVLGLTSDTLPVTTVDDYAESILAQKLSQVPGVGLVGVGGMQHPAIRIQFNPAQLAANGLSLEDVRTALTNVSVDQPKGSLYGPARTTTLQTNDQILTPDDWNNQIIDYRNGGPIRVSDVGKAIIGPQDTTLMGWVNLKRGIVLAIQRLPGANVISTVDAIKAALPQLETSIPPSIKVSVIADRTTTIRASVADVQFTLILTIALVVGVIFVFLRSLWATIIPAIAVPVSIIGTFGVMYALGYSLDNLSLMGLSIAVGFVVDDAIVMVENIARHIEMGKKPLQAALDAGGEIGFTILSISISLVAVFIPLLLMSGMVGRMFQEFAVTVTVAIAVSALVSLTLTPMMGSRLLRHERPEEQGRLARGLEWCFDALLAGYDRALIVALRHRFVTLMVMLGTVVLTGWLFVIIPKGVLPRAGHRAHSWRNAGGPGRLASRNGHTAAAGAGSGPEGWRGRGCQRLHWRGRSHLDGKSGARVHCAQTQWPAPANFHSHGQAQSGNEWGHRPSLVHATSAGHQHRWSPDRDAIPVHVDRCGPNRAQSVGADRPERTVEAAPGHRSDE